MTRFPLAASAVCLCALPALAFPPALFADGTVLPPVPRPAPSLAVALAEPAKLPPIVLKPLTPAEQAEVERAAAQTAQQFRQQFPNTFPGGADIAPAAATKPAAPTRLSGVPDGWTVKVAPPGSGEPPLDLKWTYHAVQPAAPARPANPRTLPLGSWTRSDGAVVAEVRVIPDAIQFVAAPAAGKPGATLTVTADYAVAAGGGSVFGVVTHCDLSGGPTPDRDKHSKLCETIEGAPFAVSVRFVNGEMLVGRPKVAGPDGPKAFDLPFLAGTYKPAAGNAALQAQAAPAPAGVPAPVVLGGVVGQELGAMVGDMAGRPKAGAVLGSAVGAAVGTVLGQRAADDGARSALEALQSVAGWLGLNPTADSPAAPTVVVPDAVVPAGGGR